MYDTVLQGMIRYWRGILDDDSLEITPQSNLMDDLSISSLEMLNSLIALEEDYGIVIPERALKTMITLEDVARVITQIAEKQK